MAGARAVGTGNGAVHDHADEHGEPEPPREDLANPAHGNVPPAVVPEVVPVVEPRAIW